EEQPRGQRRTGSQAATPLTLGAYAPVALPRSRALGLARLVSQPGLLRDRFPAVLVPRGASVVGRGGHRPISSRRFSGPARSGASARLPSDRRACPTPV